jgi:hypothetical protein
MYFVMVSQHLYSQQKSDIYRLPNCEAHVDTTPTVKNSSKFHGMASVLRVFLVKQILPLSTNLGLPHKKSAFSVKQATIGTVFTETSPKSDIRSLWRSKYLFFNKMSLFKTSLSKVVCEGDTNGIE